MIYSEKLNLSDEIIKNETDINSVINWKKEIEKELADFHLRTSRYQCLSNKQKAAKSALLSLRNLCKSKIGEYNLKLKEEGKWKSKQDFKSERHLASVFMELAKLELNKDEYNRILNLAKEKIIKQE